MAEWPKFKKNVWATPMTRFFTLVHLNIGVLYFEVASLLGVLAGLQSLVFRLELSSLGSVVLLGDGHFYNCLVTAHGLIIVFGFIIGTKRHSWPNWNNSICYKNQKPTRNSFIVKKRHYKVITWVFWLSAKVGTPPLFSQKRSRIRKQISHFSSFLSKKTADSS